MQAHPAAELFPLIEGPEFQGLVEDIRKHGLREPIITFKGQILDGRNRFRACEAAQVQPRFEEWPEDGDVVEYVVSKNLHRRHLNESQRGFVAAQLAVLKQGDVGAQRSDIGIQVPTQAEAARLLNVGRDTVSSARRVLVDGTEEEKAAVMAGEASVHTIARQIRAGRTAPERKKVRGDTLAATGKNPERIQRLQIKAEVWGRVRDALTHLTSLPHPADVAALVRANDKTGLVEARIQSAIKWLGEFHAEWSKRNAA